MGLSIQMFKQHFEIIYKNFLDSTQSEKFGASYSGLARFLGMSVGKIQSWRELGKWPNTPDIAVLHEKMGFSYHWLITGEGDPFDGEPPKPAAPPVPDQSDEIARLRAELDEERRLNRQLVTRLLIDGVGDKEGSA